MLGHMTFLLIYSFVFKEILLRQRFICFQNLQESDNDIDGFLSVNNFLAAALYRAADILRGHTPKQGFVPANPNDFIGRLVTL